MHFEPRPYQQYNIKRVIEEPYYGAFLDMGLGKTIITLSAIEYLAYRDMSVRKVLIVAPKTVVQGVWQDECDKWDHTKKIKITEVIGSAKERDTALCKPGVVYAINYENLVWLCKRCNYALDRFFDMVVFDESSKMKGYDTKRFKTFKKSSEYVSRIVLLTGTPSPKDYMDLWAQVFTLDRGERLGHNITLYRSRYFSCVRKGSYTDYNLIHGADKIIQKRISDICVSMSASDYLKDLPDILYIDKRLRLSNKTYKAYKDFKRDKVLELIDSMGLVSANDIDKVSALVIASNAASLRSKLLQFTNGAVYLGKDEFGRDREGYVEYHNEKIEYALDIVYAAKGRPVLMTYQFKHDKERLFTALKDAGYNVRVYKDSRDKNDWNNRLIDVLLVHPGSTGYGLNLQQGGSIIVWFGLTDNLEHYLQLNKRLHRDGQTETVRCIRITASGTEDENVISGLAGKEINQKQLIAALKADIRKYI